MGAGVKSEHSGPRESQVQVTPPTRDRPATAELPGAPSLGQKGLRRVSHLEGARETTPVDETEEQGLRGSGRRPGRGRGPSLPFSALLQGAD